MSLTIFNGSPRGKNSNSALITHWLIDGLNPNTNIHTHFLNKVSHHNDALMDFDKNSKFVFIFPLYVDGMPGQVKHFIEQLKDNFDDTPTKEMLFIIHSGFSETIHNRSLERYLNHFCTLMNIQNKGVIIIPGSEGFRLMPENATKNKHATLSTLGNQYMQGQVLDKMLIKSLQKYEILSSSQQFMYRCLNLIGLTNFYWKYMLNKHSAFKKRYDAPYANNPTKITTSAYITNRK